MQFGFSFTGLAFLLLLFLPNFIWTKYKPQDYDRYAANENKILLALERIGEASVSALVLIFRNHDPNFTALSLWLLWYAGACLLMLLYEIYWIRYFRSPKRMQDFYSSLLGIPVPGATLPVAAFFLLSIYGKNPFLLAAVTVLGVGHIGIHLCHRREL